MRCGFQFNALFLFEAAALACPYVEALLPSITGLGRGRSTTLEAATTRMPNDWRNREGWLSTSALCSVYRLRPKLLGEGKTGTSMGWTRPCEHKVRGERSNVRQESWKVAHPRRFAHHYTE